MSTVTVRRRYLIPIDHKAWNEPTFAGHPVLEMSLALRPSVVRQHVCCSVSVLRLLSLQLGWMLDSVEHETRLLEATPETSLALVQALVVGELRGQYEEDATWQLFWDVCVRDDRGLRSLASVSRSFATFYARMRWHCAIWCPNGHRSGSIVGAMSGADRDDRDHLWRSCPECGFEEKVSKAALDAAIETTEAP